MVTGSELRNEVNPIFENGHVARFRYFTSSYPGAGSSYDDDVTLTQSGADFWTTGLMMPLGWRDSSFLKEGLVEKDDKAFYTPASVQTSGIWRVGIGSPPNSEFYQVGNSPSKVWSIANEDIYKKLYLRRLPTGSLPGE